MIYLQIYKIYNNMQLLKGDNYKREINQDKISTNNVSVGGVSLVQTNKKKENRWGRDKILVGN